MGAADGSNTPYRTLITYKETHFDAPIDPQDPPTWTGTWRDPRFSPPADGGQPGERADRSVLRRQLRNDRHPGALAVRQAPAVAQHRGRQRSPSGQTLTLGAGIGTLGYEWDEDADNGFRPAGLFDLSSTTRRRPQAFTDYGSNVADNRHARPIT